MAPALGHVFFGPEFLFRKYDQRKKRLRGTFDGAQSAQDGGGMLSRE